MDICVGNPDQKRTAGTSWQRMERETKYEVIKVKVKVKLSLGTTPWRRIGEWRYSFTLSLTSALDGGEWSASCPGRFTPRERAPGTH
jgi:hypothetical protein